MSNAWVIGAFAAALAAAVGWDWWKSRRSAPPPQASVRTRGPVAHMPDEVAGGGDAGPDDGGSGGSR